MAKQKAGRIHMPIEEKVRAIRKEYDTGRFTILDLADRYGISKSEIHRIIRGKSHADIHPPASERQRGRGRREGPAPHLRRFPPAVEIKIRAEYASGKESLRALAKRYECSYELIRQIVSERADERRPVGSL